MNCNYRKIYGKRSSLPIFHTLLFTVVLLLPAMPTAGQNLPTLDFSGRPGDKRPELLDRKPESPPPALNLPATPVPEKSIAEEIVKGVFV
ncbi:MAG: hypothetical protein H7X83_04745, partial [Verrucomicrobia bacterium]|nr:hypothetical protein [Deltaproteobacteria bacterium]